MKHRFVWRILVLAAFAALCIAAAGLAFFAHGRASLAKDADRIIALCTGEAYRPACYDREIPKLMDRGLSMEDAFAVTAIIQRKDASYSYCHVLGHELAAKEVAKDPSKWKDVITRVPMNMCSNGGIHGAFQERFRKDNVTPAELEALKPELMNICAPHGSWHPTRLEQATCTHALGHLAMYVTGGDIDRSLELCAELAFRELGYDFTQMCYDGAFMQIFQPLEPDDFALVEGKQPTAATVESFCGTFKGLPHDSCWTESWPLSLSKIKQPGGLVSFCAALSEGAPRDRCYDAMLYVLTPIVFKFDTGSIAGFCDALPAERQGGCFSAASSRLIETDWGNIQKAVGVCEAAGASADACYSDLVHYSTYNFQYGSKEFYALCNALPSAWQQRCTLSR